jgi:CubicO group peptidase (beta-lactamase class C family)
MTLGRELDELLRNAVDRAELPGVVALAADDSGMLYEGAFGRRSLGADAPFTNDTIAFFASMTKAITTTAAMQLVEQDRLALDAPAARVCAELGALDVLEGFDDTGKPRLRPARSAVTLRQLLTHTGGYSYEFNDPGILRWLEVTQTPDVLSGTRATLRRPLVRDPGTRWDYGIGIDWVGRMIEETTGQRLGEYLRANVLDPLGMHDTGFRVTPEGRRRLAGVHARHPDGRLEPLAFETPRDAELDMGGHGLYGPMTDFVRFLRAILGGGALDGARILRKDTVDAMARSHTGALGVRPLKSSLPAWSNDVDFAPGIDCGFGLGFAINLSDFPGGRSAGSLWWAGLTNSYYWIDPAKRIACVLLTQILPFFDASVVALTRAVEQAIYRRRM